MVTVKDVRSTTLERLCWTRAADRLVVGLPQPLQLGHGLHYLLDHIDVPVAPDDLLLGRIRETVPDAAQEAFFQETVRQWGNRAIPPWMQDGGHECLAWELLLAHGLPGLEARAAAGLSRFRAGSAAQPRRDYLHGAVLVYRALRQYARRYSRAARQAGLPEAETRCAALAVRPPETFAEALQLIWLVGLVYCTMVAVNPTLTFGRLDVLLHAYYRRDLLAGRLSRAAAGALIRDFYGKNELILGRGEHQLSGHGEHATGWHRNLAYDAPQYVVLGGRQGAAAAASTDLTDLFLEQVEPRNENPVIVLRYHRELAASTWQRACACMRANASFMVYNDANVVAAMEHCGVAPEHALTYTMHGCNWPDIPGCQRDVRSLHANLPQLLLDALLELPAPLTSMEPLYDGLATRLGRELGQHCDALRAARRRWPRERPGLLRVDDCFLDGPMARACSWQQGGVAYPTVLCSLLSLATAADSLAAVDELVLRRGRVSLPDLQEALRQDFRDHEPLRQLCLQAPKFGQDDDRADAHAVRLLTRLQAEIDAVAGGPDPVIVFRCLETDMRHIGYGARTGATPDGRHAGRPLSENTSPYPGSSRHGLTAMLRSVAKLPLRQICSGALNVRLAPRLLAGDRGLAVLSEVLRTYLDLGGLQVQLSVVDTQTLRRAQRCPAEHRDLMVRITGYSAVFVDMAPAAQEEIIRRDELGVG